MGDKGECAAFLVNKDGVNSPKTDFSLGAPQQVYAYMGDKGECAAFLANKDGVNSADVEFQNRTYQPSPKSISILPDYITVAFNTAKTCLSMNTHYARSSFIFI